MTGRYRLDDLTIDVPRQRVERDGVVLDVGGLSFRLLQVLLEQGQRVVGFDELMDKVWAPAVVNEETVTQRVRLLRQSLGDDGRSARYVRSVRGQGYQLCIAPQPLTDAESTQASRPRGWIVAAVVATVALVVVVAWWWQRAAPAERDDAASPLLQRAAYYAGIGQRDDNERAIALYRQRLQEAPDDRAAQVGLSRAFAARACQYSGTPDDAVRAQTLAERVLAVEPRNAAAHAALGYSFDCRGRVDDALRGYERAVQLDPGADGARGSAAYLYERRGRLADALAANLAVRDPARVRFHDIQVASNLDLLGYTAAAEARYRRSFQLYPDNVFSNLAWPTFLMRHGRDAEARAVLDEAMARGTEHAGLHMLAAELALRSGDRTAARASVERAQALRPQASLPRTVAWTLQDVAPPTATLRTQAQALREGLHMGSEPVDALDAALLLDATGDRDTAFTALREAVDAGYRDAPYLRASPLFAGLRSDARFARVLAGIERAIASERDVVRARGLEARAGVTASP